jgi:hypothetical protein
LGEEYRSFSSSLCSFLHSPVTSSLLGPYTFFNTLFSNTLSLRSSLNVSDHVSHPYKNLHSHTCNNIVDGDNITVPIYCMISRLEKPMVFDLRHITQRRYSIDNKAKFKAVSVHVVKAYAGVEVQLLSFLT